MSDQKITRETTYHLPDCLPTVKVEHSLSNWGYLQMFFLLFVVAYLLSGCGTLPSTWCKTPKVEALIVGEPQIKRCDNDACEAARGEYIVSDSWILEQAKMMERLISKIEKGEQ